MIKYLYVNDTELESTDHNELNSSFDYNSLYSKLEWEALENNEDAKFFYVGYNENGARKKLINKDVDFSNIERLIWFVTSHKGDFLYIGSQKASNIIRKIETSSMTQVGEFVMETNDTFDKIFISRDDQSLYTIVNVTSLYKIDTPTMNLKGIYKENEDDEISLKLEISLDGKYMYIQSGKKIQKLNTTLMQSEGHFENKYKRIENDDDDYNEIVAPSIVKLSSDGSVLYIFCDGKTISKLITETLTIDHESLAIKMV